MIFKVVNQKFHESVNNPGIFSNKQQVTQNDGALQGMGAAASNLMTGIGGKLKGALWFGGRSHANS